MKERCHGSALLVWSDGSSLIENITSDIAERPADFHGAVDDYLALCEAEGKAPEKAFKGSFNVRISPELHKKLAVRATAQQISLNSYVEQALANSVLL